jgi:uncharacterized membrane protein
MAGTQAESYATASQLVDDENRIADRLYTQSGHYLIIGTLCAIFGAGYSAYLTLVYRTNGFNSDQSWSLNLRGEPFPSGNNFFPPSVSNSVSDVNSAGGQVFFGFMVASSILTVISAYPFNFANVFVGGDVSLFPCWAPRTCWPDMNTWRAYVAPIGIMLTAFCHSLPANLFNPAQQHILIIHTGGAVLWIGIPLYVETYTLWWAKHVSIGRRERQLRISCVILALICSVVYGFFGNTSAGAYGVCCDEVYRNVTQADVDMANKNGAYAVAQVDLKLMQHAKFDEASPPVNQALYDTASGMARTWKMAGFFGELGAGLFLMLDIVVIWFFGKPFSVHDSTSMLIVDKAAE